ncbi:hypothetical protein [Clostridium cadaveris]|uniref:hypothetical protein n=1 Tax=Clostridium cadaveris TaxID=1529 RepID=UPI0015B5F20C|nr:hypothetical protein [Clostridium cadaveris]NWK10394.1 hypothetical protein [Clostridium cadaveris]
MKRIISLLLCLILSFSITGCGKKEVKGEVKDYNIVEKEDVSTSKAILFNYRVSVPDDNKYSKEDFKNIATDVKEKSDPFNAITIFFYKEKEINDKNFDGFSKIGNIEFSPWGLWNRAEDINTGDLKNIKLVDKLK